MAKIIDLDAVRHARASSAGCCSANASKVTTSEQPLSPAKRTRAAQRCAGTPRERQVLTVFRGKPSASATAAVPPSASMAKCGIVGIDPLIVRTPRTSQEFARRETTFPVFSGPIASMVDPPDVIGPRLKALRLALGIKSQIEFAQKIGVEKQTYNPWENGKRPLTFEGALLIRKRFRIPLEFLFFGEFADELPHRIRQALGSAA